MTLDNFKEWLTINCEEANTVNTYHYQMVKLFDFVKEPLTQEKINSYFMFFIETKKSNSSFNMVIKALRKYAEFSKESFELPKYKNSDKRINKFYSQEEIESLIIPYIVNLFPRNYDKVEIIFKLLFLTGLRRKELITLKRDKINLKKGEIELINTKGNRDRIIPIDKILISQITLFFKKYPEEINAFNITKASLEYIYAKLNRELKLEKKINTRICRHGCATNMVKKNVDLFCIQKILGHRDLKTTQIYADPDIDTVKEIYNQKIKGF